MQDRGKPLDEILLEAIQSRQRGNRYQEPGGLQQDDREIVWQQLEMSTVVKF